MSSIFISSTFQDMQQERDILQNSVLPRIKDLAKQYGKNIDLCDLRWGINSSGMSEEESTAKVLQVCFDEIDHAKPFFIAILGDRYGWVPNAKAAENLTMGRSIQTGDLLDKSVTEMEIIYGALKNEDSDGVRFYFREIRNKRKGLFSNPDLPGYFLSRTSDDRKRMRALKEKIEKQFPRQVRTYSVIWNNDASRLEGLEQFAEMLFRDIRDMIVQRWGPVPEPSKYEYQLYQYQYAVSGDDFFADEPEPLSSDGTHPDNLVLNETTMRTQNYVLVSQDEHSLDMLFSSLCRRYAASEYTVIPYECSQSVLSSSTENMIRYFVDILARHRKNGGEKPDDADRGSLNEIPAKFHAALAALDDETERPVILAIRNIQYLDGDNVFDWLPVTKFKHIHFLLSSDKVLSGPSQYRENTSEFYFQENRIFGRDRLIKAYMAQYHKEPDDEVYYALIDKADKKDDQYLELLMHRLLVLTREDYEAIRNSGDGMENISLYLRRLIDRSPEHTADFVLEQVSLLETETGAEFTKAVLSILSVLPYGISRNALNGVLNAGHVPFSMLDMTLLCRRLSGIVNVTLDGYYRMIQTPAAKIISDSLIGERAKWSSLIEKYMSAGSSSAASGNPDSTADELYRCQYPEVALRTRKTTAFSEYLKNVNYDAAIVSLVLRRLVSNQALENGLAANFRNLTSADIKWLITDFYEYLSGRKLLLNKAFALRLRDLWEILLSCLPEPEKPSEEENHIRFRLLYQLGELSYFHDADDADRFLTEAKSVSKANFAQYPNRVWKIAHGIALTDEEKRRGYDALDIREPIADDSFIFGFDGEIEDMEFEQSWSSIVRIINNYLSHIYRKRGDIRSAEKLEAESKKLTHISDPDPQRRGNREIVPGITVVWPDDPDGGKRTGKRPYKPDLRRNSAIQIAREARRLHEEEKYEEALAKYAESNGILKEIYEDGETGRYYDLKGVEDNPAELGKRIQKECARDLGLNFNDMIFCTQFGESDGQLRIFLDEMISWGQIYDDYRNNRQSKSDLEHYYLISAEVYSIFGSAAYFDRIVRDIDRYFTYRLEAHLKGEQTDDTIIRERERANTILCQAVMHNPGSGPQITDLLLRQSNASVKADDFNGFLQLTYLAENLLRWTWENNLHFVGTHCSLEYIFFSNISNQCMLWEQHHMDDRLKQDADRIVGMLGNVRESGNVLSGVQSVMRYAMHIFGSGDYRAIVPYADVMFDTVRKTDDLPDIELAGIYEKLLAIYSEAEVLEKAHIAAGYNEALLEKMEQKGYPDQLRQANITPPQYKAFVITKKMIVYLNHAVALSRMEKPDDADVCLSMAEALAAEHPDIAGSESGIMQRISLFRKNGLPGPKRGGDSEKVYRRYKDEIETTLSRCLRKEPYDAALLEQVVQQIEKMTRMPEHEIYRSTYTVAKYYHVLNMLFAAIGCRDSAFEMLLRAADLADNADKKEELYAEIFSDLCAYTDDPEARLELSRKALAIYEDLQKQGKECSLNSYAMLLYNSAIILMEQGDCTKAMEYARKASSIWESILTSDEDDQIKLYYSEAKRLLAFLKTKAE
ncbi:MAG: DUF4062 domain-containing protein [Clostridia bacterium]|nr:DUF4062 domain-containing protein [Clostridia bacterium]